MEVEVNDGKNLSYRSFDCNLQICIIKNDARRIPTKLKRNLDTSEGTGSVFPEVLSSSSNFVVSFQNLYVQLVRQITKKSWSTLHDSFNTPGQVEMHGHPQTFS